MTNNTKELLAYPAHEKLAKSCMTINYADAIYGANVYEMYKEFRALLAQVNALTEALEYYADKNNYLP